LFFIAAKIVISLYKQENPGKKKRQDFQEPKTKIYETFFLQKLSFLQGFFIQEALQKYYFFLKCKCFFKKK